MACLECDRLMRELKSANEELRMLIDESYIRATRPGFIPPSVNPLLKVQTRLNVALADWMRHCANGDHA